MINHPVQAKFWDIETENPANYYYAIVLQFKEEDLNRNLFYVDVPTSYYVGQTMAIPINLFAMGGGKGESIEEIKKKRSTKKGQ